MNATDHPSPTARTADGAFVWVSKGQRRKMLNISRRTNDADIAAGIKNGTLRVKSFGQRCQRIAVPLADIPVGGLPPLRRTQEPKVAATAERPRRAEAKRRAVGKAVRK